MSCYLLPFQRRSRSDLVLDVLAFQLVTDAQFNFAFVTKNHLVILPSQRLVLPRLARLSSLLNAKDKEQKIKQSTCLTDIFKQADLSQNMQVMAHRSLFHSPSSQNVSLSRLSQISQPSCLSQIIILSPRPSNRFSLSTPSSQNRVEDIAC